MCSEELHFGEQILLNLSNKAAILRLQEKIKAILYTKTFNKTFFFFFGWAADRGMGD